MSLGLTYHEKYIQEYLEFSRRKRIDCVRSIQSAYDSLTEARLMEDNTFTNAEVRDMVTGLWTAMEVDLKDELISTSHMTAVLLQQLFQQAEKVHMKMQPRIAEIENRELLEEMAAYEQQQQSTVPSLQVPTKRLEPLNFVGGETLLQKEIDRLTTENNKLKERLQLLEKKASTFLEEKDKLKSELSSVPSPLPSLLSSQGDNNNDEMKSLKLQYTQSQEELKQIKIKLNETTEELLCVSKELERTKEELDKKVSQTSQFQTLKKLLESKNEQLKELRSQLKIEENK